MFFIIWGFTISMAILCGWKDAAVAADPYIAANLVITAMFWKNKLDK